MWSLGCLVHELLTSQRVFCEASDFGTDIITGLDTRLDTEEPSVNIMLLYDYCRGKADFPDEYLQSSGASAHAIDLVRSLLVPDPKARVTAAIALQSPWLATLGYKNAWCNSLEANFLELGITLDLGTRQDQALMRQIHTIDVARFLPTSATNDLPALLAQAIDKGLRHATQMLVNSPVRIVNDPSGVQRLFDQAVRARQIDSVKVLLDVGNMDIDVAGSDGKTAVQVAVANGWCDLLQLLMNKNVKLDTTAENSQGGRTLFQEAAGRGHMDVVRLLLEDLAKVNAEINAAIAAYEDGVEPSLGWVPNHLRRKFLLSKTNINANINAKPSEDSGRTALQAAAENGHLDIVALLLTNDADINAQPANRSGRTALQAAAESGHLEVSKFLLSNNANVDHPPAAEYGLTALQGAASRGHLDIVKLLLDNRANVDLIRRNETAPQGTAGTGHFELDQPRFDNRPYQSGRRMVTALQCAAGNGHLDVVMLLVANGADVNTKPADSSGRTALLVAAEGGHVEVARFLLARSAAIDNKPGIDSSPTVLQAAAGNGHLAMVQILLENDADLNDNHDGRSALHHAAASGHLEVMKLLLENDADINERETKSRGETVFQAAAGSGNMEAVEFLLNNAANINAKAASEGGRTALQAAAENGHIEVVRFLLANDAKVNAKPASINGRTALQAAAGGGHLDVVRLLFDADAKINAKPAYESGRTALQAAAWTGHLEIAAFLLEHQAQVNAKPAVLYGKTAIQAASDADNVPMMELLLANGATRPDPEAELRPLPFHRRFRQYLIAHLDIKVTFTRFMIFFFVSLICGSMIVIPAYSFFR